MYLLLSRGESSSSWRDVRWGRLTQTRSVRKKRTPTRDVDRDAGSRSHYAARRLTGKELLLVGGIPRGVGGRPMVRGQKGACVIADCCFQIPPSAFLFLPQKTQNKSYMLRCATKGHTLGAQHTRHTRRPAHTAQYSRHRHAHTLAHTHTQA